MYLSSQTARPVNFGQGGVVLRARANETLSLDDIRARVPSVFAEDKHSSRSEKYSYIPTSDLLLSMATKKEITAVRKWWKAGRNIWEISQLTGIAEATVTEIVRAL